METTLKVNNLSKEFRILKSKKTFFRLIKSLIKKESLLQSHHALHDISFELKKGDKVALVGKNGAGKTTLLRILSGIYKPTSGDFELKMKLKCLFRFWSGFHNELSILENVYFLAALFGVTRENIEPHVDEILKFSNLYNIRYSYLKDISLGQMQRLALSIFFKAKGDIIIFDESLSFVDENFQKTIRPQLDAIFNNPNTTVIMTSHNSQFLKQYCSKAIWLEEGKLKSFSEINTIINQYTTFTKS